MATRESLVQSMQLPEETVQRINARGLAIADVDSMSHAIHDVYCGIMADHDHPSDKDREQAQRMIDALQKHASTAA